MDGASFSFGFMRRKKRNHIREATLTTTEEGGVVQATWPTVAHFETIA